MSLLCGIFPGRANSPEKETLSALLRKGGTLGAGGFGGGGTPGRLSGLCTWAQSGAVGLPGEPLPGVCVLWRGQGGGHWSPRR